MKKTVKVVMLPTEKATHLIKDIVSGILTFDKDGYGDTEYIPQHLYLISDDEIKEGDWYIATDIKSVIQCNKVTTYIHGGSTQSPKDLAKKIVATTDNTINVNYPIAEIPESFIQAYIESYNNGKPITEVDLEYKLDNYNLKGNKRIITPKTRPDNTVIVHQAKMYTRDEVEKLLGKILADSNNPKYTVQDRGDRFTMDQIFPLNKWIQDNL